MSDLLIRGIELPKSRPVCIVIDAAGQARRYDLNNDRYADDKLFEAVPVPPHGRLIDASESIRVELYDEEHEDWTRHDMTIDDLLSQSWVDADAPTIIPAEEGE